MTSANVTQTAGFRMSEVAAAGAANTLNSAADDSFSQVMDRTVQTSDKGRQNVSQNEKSIQAKSPVQKVSKNTVKDSTQKTQSEDTDPQTGITDEVKDAVEEAVQEVKEAVAEQLGISVEDLEQLMEELGISAVGLLDQSNIQPLVMAAVGETDELNLLTDGDLYQTVQDLTQTVGELLQEVQTDLQVDDEGMAKILEQMEMTEPEALQEDLLADGETQKGPIVIFEETGSQEPTATVRTEVSQTVQTQTAGETEKIADAAQDTVPESATTEEHVEIAVPENGRDDKASAQGREGGENHMFSQNFAGQNTQVFGNDLIQTEQSLPVETADTQRIMEQITEYIKIEAKPEMTEMELQLQPETLGTINVRLSSKEGAVTAYFTAQNDTVRAAIETQLVQLKDSLNDQGIKVDAVEVTVASHEFERNLQQDRNGEDEGQYRESKRKGIRRIRLDGEESIEDMELSDEERITAEMMEQNGNTVDFTA